MSTTETELVRRDELPPLPADTFQERMGVLFRLSPGERRRVARRGELTYAEACKWAARFPDEVELVDGEFWFIAQHTPEARDAA
jgi:hypothetical protein